MPKKKTHSEFLADLGRLNAHADDLELQMGGTLAKYHQGYGYDIVYVMTTNNMSSDGQIEPGSAESDIRDGVNIEELERDGHA